MTSKPSAAVKEMTFSGGDKFTFDRKEKIIIVGPNNSGKSEALREIVKASSGTATERNIVVTSLSLEKSGTKEELRTFLEENAEFEGTQYRYKNWHIGEDIIKFWSNDVLQHGLLGGFLKAIDAKNRLSICDDQGSVAPGQPKTTPQHVLYDDEALMKKISGLFRNAFGQDLMFDFRGGSQIPIHVGDSAKLMGHTDRVGDAYVKAVREYPTLDKQGDGMKSYAGILFESVVNTVDITLIDEPEAFLHPPQMRRLGETLSSELIGQLFVATHSSDILRGFLEGTQGKIKILRISRSGQKNIVSEAAPEIVKDLWTRPELKYSNALEGIFHEQTIICEDDSDCRLINAVADHLAGESDDLWKDTAYIPTGGKHGVPKIASALRKIGVPVKVIFDLDFLSEKGLVKTTVEAFGATWTEFETLWSRVDAAVRQGNKPKSPSEIKQELLEIINRSEDAEIPKSDIIDAMKQDKPWSEVKRFGEIAVPKGEAQANYQALKNLLASIGVFLVPVGEIENFCPEIGSHGPKHVTKLLSNVPLSDPKLEKLRSFVNEVHRGSTST